MEAGLKGKENHWSRGQLKKAFSVVYEPVVQSLMDSHGVGVRTVVSGLEIDPFIRHRQRK